MVMGDSNLRITPTLLCKLPNLRMPLVRDKTLSVNKSLDKISTQNLIFLRLLVFTDCKWSHPFVGSQIKLPQIVEGRV